MLKNQLLKLKEKDYKLNDGSDIHLYLEDLITHIGDLDPVLRDDLIYMAFAYWITEYQYFDQKTLEDLTNRLLSDDCLFHNISTINDDIFKRSFSALTLSLVLYQEKEKPLLSQTCLDLMAEKITRYFELEKDYRGFTEHGWAHGLAHCADAFNFLLACQSEKDYKMSVLETVVDKLLSIDQPLTAEEPERLATPILNHFINNQEFDNTTIIDQFNKLLSYKEINDTMHHFFARSNIKQFLRAIYFRLDLTAVDQSFLDYILHLEQEFNSFKK